MPPGAALGEGPRWDAETSTLLWVDIVGRAVHRYDPATGADESRPVADLVSLALPRARGGVIVGLPDGIHALDDQGTAPLVALEPGRRGTRTNDGACDARGRLWVGTMARDERSPVAGLYRVDADLTVTAVLGGTTISNGLGWSPGGDAFYFIDSPTRRVDVFDCDPASGALEGRRPLIAIELPGAVPDGMAVDAEGCLWVALHGGWGLRRYASGRRVAGHGGPSRRPRDELRLRRARPARPVRDHAPRRTQRRRTGAAAPGGSAAAPRPRRRRPADARVRWLNAALTERVHDEMQRQMKRRTR